MPVKPFLSALLLFVPATAMAASDVAANAERCMALGREIAGTTQVIGDTDVARSYADVLSQQAQEIRKIRREMSRMRCSSGSIVEIGAPADVCEDFQATLSAMEDNRRAIIEQRQTSMKVVNSLGRDEAALREEMRLLRCGEIDYATIPASIAPDGSLRPSTSLPPAQSIIEFKPKQQEARRDPTPAVPEREWKPDRPVRMVGPQFFPDQSRIDLANPATPGAQPQQ
ncbi:hypothetical protein [Rhizobium sp. SL86]|uniref:hypothetical protein n=1 Tax=Rhizobium sp. SL86 TaxID=2995148 RepID=UPI002273D0FF|nr:hypothetical protein [Rhizobium sp. SL86]MCY1668880.1 hypothetical protein [Rhizobium sp. SL86]